MAAATLDPLDCHSCLIVQPVVDDLPAYARKVYEAMFDPADAIFWSGVAILFATMIIQAAATGEANFKETIKATCYVIGAGLALGVGGTELLWAYSYELTHLALAGMGKLAVLGGTETIAASDGDLMGLITAVEAKFWRVLQLSTLLLKDAKWTQPHLMVLSVLLSIPFVFLLVFFLGHVVSALLTIAAVATLGPWFVAAFAFKGTRSITMNAIKVGFAQILRVFFSTFALGLTFYMVDKVFAGFPIDDAGQFTVNVQEFIYSKAYWGVVIIALLGILFQWEVGGVAGNISQMTVSSVGPAMFAAAVTGATRLGGSKAGQLAGNFAHNLAASPAVQRLRDALSAGKAKP